VSGALDTETRGRIESLIRSNDVVLFMKGTREAPRCGFSATVVRVLDQLISDYRTVDVLSDAKVREGVKEFSQWPTIPQLYVRGEFVGGCDIVQELDRSGELPQLLGIDLSNDKAPRLKITDAAALALRKAVANAGAPAGSVLQLAVDARYQSGLSLGPAGDGDVVVTASAIEIHLDRLSASRAEGAVIDVAETPEGLSFRIDIPKARPAAS
jgi:monothiol glutaredoxin